MADAKISALTEKTTITSNDRVAVVDVSQSNTVKHITLSELQAAQDAKTLKSVTNGGTGADLTSTGGANQFVKQSGVGNAFTVGVIAEADVPSASDTAQGDIEIATQAEVDAGSSTTLAVAPDTLNVYVVANTEINVGEMKMWPIDTLPNKWLLCQGQVINRTTYADLFAEIGTTFGVGNGSTTFNVPDFRDLIPFGVSGGFALASTGGTATHTLTEAEMPAHTHTLNFDDVDANATGVTRTIKTSSTVTGSTGGGNAHNNLPAYVAIHFIIYTGVSS